jgi:hypothetical protein
MANCTGIFQGSGVSCDDPLVTGLRQRLLLANLEDIEEFTHSVVPGEENVITGIIMKATKTFFEFDGVKQSISCQSDIVNGSVSVGYDHTVNLSVFQVGSEDRRNLQAMAYKPQVAILEASSPDTSLGNGIFQVYGQTRGLEVLTNTRIDADQDTGGAYVLQIKTSDAGGKETSLPEVFFTVDYATTLAAVNALLPVPIP